MPELPEVETIVRQLKPALEKETISSVHAYWHRTVQMTAEQLEMLCLKQLVDVKRRGKWILILLSDGSRLAIHLRMSGRLSLKPIAGKQQHLRAEFSFFSGRRLFFYDPRKFGRILLLKPGEKNSLDKLGVEPLNESDLWTALSGLQSRRAVKTILLDQHIISGIGNIYADEALFLAEIHPETPFLNLEADQRIRLSVAIRTILLEAIENGGSSISDYRGLAGMPGFQQLRHQVYQREGQSCFRCKSPIIRICIGGRSSHYCPTCQPWQDAGIGGHIHRHGLTDTSHGSTDEAKA